MQHPGETFQLTLCPLPAAFSCGYARFGENEVHVTRYNPDYVLLFMTGHTLYFTEDGEERLLMPGDWYMQLPGKYQGGIRPSPGAEYYYLHFRPVAPPADLGSLSFLNGMETAPRLPVRGRYAADAVLPLLDRLRHRIGQPDIFLEQQRLFLQVLEEWMRFARENAGNGASKELRLAEKIMTALCVRYAAPFPKEELEREFHYTYDYLCRVFRKKYGQTPLQYLSGLRVRREKELLEFTDKPIGDIARQAGYASEFAFSKHFRRASGLSPSAFRQRQRARSGPPAKP